MREDAAVRAELSRKIESFFYIICLIQGALVAQDITLSRTASGRYFCDTLSRARARITLFFE